MFHIEDGQVVLTYGGNRYFLGPKDAVFEEWTQVMAAEDFGERAD